MGNSATYLREVFQENEHPGSAAPFVDVTGDPRSPTAEITRTPIEVGVLTRASRRRARTLDSTSPIANRSYVPAEDTDDYENFMVKFHKLRILENDPRSPTVGIARTPIEVFTSPENNSSCTSIKSSKSMDDLSLSPELPSIRLCDPRSPSTEVMRTPIQVPIWKDEPQLEDCTPELNKPITPKRNKENGENLAKKLFVTPDQKDIPFQVRTPLRSVMANGNSPYQILRAKQSHGINMEMSRVSGIENTPPPCLNKYDLASTKLKQHNSSQWGQDSTFII